MKTPYIVLMCCLVSGLYAFTPSSTPSSDEEVFPVDRYALYVASNDGGPSRVRLRYAGTDAEKLAKTLTEVGGVHASKSMLLIDPTKEDINAAFETISNSIKNTKEKVRRTEFIFYYSGHSDETSLILGRESYGYSQLKKDLNDVPSDVHVVMLDSCFSGNFVRTKGGTRQKPFLMDDSTVVQGHAYLSSSSEVEASQESDTIQASYFTHALVTGLRGAADTSGDKRVSLNELYHYAFNETLAKTESSIIGPQHPSYNITLVGSGDLVLTDITDAECMIHIPSNYEGKYFIRNLSGILVSEINKIRGTEVALALPAGYYNISLITPTATTQATITLDRGSKMSLDSSLFGAVPRTYGRARGDSEEEVAEEWTNLSISVLPGLNFPKEQALNAHVSVAAFLADNKKIDGVQVAGFMSTISESLDGVQLAGFMSRITGSFRGFQISGFLNTTRSNEPINGVQVSGFLNTTKGTVNGIQLAGFMNNSQDLLTGIQIASFLNLAGNSFNGLQISGFLNNAGGKSEGIQISPFLNIAHTISGAQIGIINIAHSNTGMSLGLLNFISDGIMSPAIYGDTNGLLWLQYQGGTPTFFTSFMLGTPASWEDKLKFDYGVFGFGIGHRFNSSKRFSIDLELISKHTISKSILEKHTDILKEMEKKNDTENITDKEALATIKNLGLGNVPSVRVTGNIRIAKHFSLFGSWNADVHIKGYNENAFSYGSNGTAVDIVEQKVQLFTYLSFGLKF